MTEVFLPNGSLAPKAASRLAAMFASLAEDTGLAASVDVSDAGGVALLRRDGGGVEPVPVSAVLAEMAEMARAIEADAAEVASDARQHQAAEG